MLTMNDLDPLLRRRSTVITGEGDRVGTVGAVYLNDVDEQPTWVTVHTGLFGSRESFVPLEGASVRGRDLVVTHPRELIRHAPSVDRDGHLSPEEEAALYRHYGIRASAPPREAHPAGTAPVSSLSSVAPAADEPGTVSAGAEAPQGLYGRGPADGLHTPALEPAETLAPPQSGNVVEPAHTGIRTHDDRGTPWVVLSEERLRVGTERSEAGSVRLRKYVVTEEETVSVPLVTEEVRVVVEPITSATAVDLGTAFQEESVELVAREGVAVVGKETVAVERVRMRVVEVAGQATVRDTVRKERITIAVDGDAAMDAAGSGRKSARRTKSTKATTGAVPRTAPELPIEGPAKNTVKNTEKNTAKSSNALVKGKKKRR